MYKPVNPHPHITHTSNPHMADIIVSNALLEHLRKEEPVKDKELIWIDTDLESPHHQFDFYDQETEVNLVVKYAWKWYQKNKS
mgnify:CR=1 FL=1